MSVPDLKGSKSFCSLAIDDPIAAGAKIVTVSFDLWRYSENPQWSSNFWWWWVDAGTPTYGISWDQGSGQNSIFPFGWDAAGYTAPWWYDNYANIKMTWNFTTGRAHFWIDGWDPGTAADVAISSISSFTEWQFSLEHGEDTGSGPETVFIDNFIITTDGDVPEPSSLLTLFAGIASVSGFAIRRRR